MDEVIFVSPRGQIVITSIYIQTQYPIQLDGDRLRVIKFDKNASNDTILYYKPGINVKYSFIFDDDYDDGDNGDNGDREIILDGYFENTEIIINGLGRGDVKFGPGYINDFGVRYNVGPIFNLSIPYLLEELEYLEIPPATRLFTGVLQAQLAEYHSIPITSTELTSFSYDKIFSDELLYVISNTKRRFIKKPNNFLQSKNIYIQYLDEKIKTIVISDEFDTSLYYEFQLLAYLQYEHEWIDAPNIDEDEKYGMLYPYDIYRYTSSQAMSLFTLYPISHRDYVIKNMFEDYKTDLTGDEFKILTIMSNETIIENMVIDSYHRNGDIINKILNIQQYYRLFIRMISMNNNTDTIINRYNRIYGVKNGDIIQKLNDLIVYYDNMVTNIEIPRSQMVELIRKRDKDLIHYDRDTINKILGFKNVTNMSSSHMTMVQISEILFDNTTSFSISTNPNGCSRSTDYYLFEPYSNFVITYGPLYRPICYSIDDLLNAFIFDIDNPVFRRPDLPNITFTLEEVKDLYYKMEGQNPNMIPGFEEATTEFMTKLEPFMSINFDVSNIEKLLFILEDDKSTMIEIMITLFELGMYQRTWKGPPHPYVYKTRDTTGSTLEEIESLMLPGFAKIRELLDLLSEDTLNLLKILPTIIKYEPLEVGSNSLWTFLVATVNGDYCIGIGGQYMIESALKYLSILGYTIEEFDYSQFEGFSTQREE